MRRTKSLHPLILLAAAILTAGLPTHVAAQAPDRPAVPTQVILVRHAEKASEPSDDPPLSALGAERAQALAATLRDAGVTAIITTQLRRTRGTAQPLATANGLTPEVVPSQRGERETHVAAVAAAVRRHAGEVVLVVGHSNTIPAIIDALGGPSFPDICESVYANLFVLLPGPSTARLVKAHYGLADPQPKPDCK